MLDDLPLRWIAFCIVLLVTLQCLMSMATVLRDRLQGLLVAHVKRQQREALERQRTEEHRETLRAKKAAQESSDEKRAA
jgi:hypothetical protein